MADKLREVIAAGELLPGERLVERVLCERTGVSRTLLREALSELESEGLLTSIPNRGLIIATLTPKAAKEIFDVRASLEGLICRLFCENADDQHIEECRACHQILIHAYAQGTPKEMIVAKTRFYNILMSGADNREAERMLRSIHIRVSQLRLMSLADDTRRAASISELGLLIESLVTRNSRRAESLSRRHVDFAAKAALSKLEQSEAKEEAHMKAVPSSARTEKVVRAIV